MQEEVNTLSSNITEMPGKGIQHDQSFLRC